MIRTQAGPTPNGLFVALRGEGQLFFLLGDGNEVRVPTNGIGFLGPGMAVPQFGVTLPPALLRELPPPPETIEVDPNLLAATQEEPRPALWTSINREGDHVVVQREGTNEQLDVAFGETVVADDQAITRTTMQDWQILDRLNINPTLELTDPRLLRDAGNVADELSCVAQ